MALALSCCWCSIIWCRHYCWIKKQKWIEKLLKWQLKLKVKWCMIWSIFASISVMKTRKYMSLSLFDVARQLSVMLCGFEFHFRKLKHVVNHTFSDILCVALHIAGDYVFSNSKTIRLTCQWKCLGTRIRLNGRSQVERFYRSDAPDTGRGEKSENHSKLS